MKKVKFDEAFHQISPLTSKRFLEQNIPFAKMAFRGIVNRDRKKR